VGPRTAPPDSLTKCFGGLVASRAYEGTGINQQDVGLIHVSADGEACRAKQAEHDLGVH
jgi:hypothetical protein